MPAYALTARRLILWAALLGCLARAAFGLFYWTGKPLTHDEREYLALGANLAAGRGYSQTLPGEVVETAPGTLGVQQFGRAPVYPFFLAPLTLADPALRAGHMPADVPWAVKVAQAIVGGLGVWLIGLLAARAAGDRAGACAALIAAVYPPLVWSAAFALSEVLYSTLALAAVWVLGSVLDRRPRDQARDARDETRDGLLDRPVSARRVLAGGLLTGIAILTRPVMLFFVPFAMLLAWRQRPRLVVWLLCGVALTVLPWTARNAMTYGRFVLVASEGGITFWTGNHPQAGGEGDLAANPQLKELNRALRLQHLGLSEEELESIYYREALTFIATHPVQWLGLLAKKLFYTWVPIGPSYRLHSARYFWGSVLSYVAVLPFAALGAIWLYRNGRQPWTLWSLAASAWLVCVMFFPQERFRIPVVDPTLIICAAAQLARPSVNRPSTGR